MILKKISLVNFRNFEKANFYFNPFLTIIIGQNSVGKTNLLEAIYFVSHGMGIRERNQEELIFSGKTRCEVEAQFGQGEENTEFRIILDKLSVLNKIYFVSRVKKRFFEYSKFGPSIAIFSPSFIFVIEGEPRERRDYFDKIISSLDLEYKKRLANYETALRKRNKLLEREKDIARLKEQLIFWDDYLITEAAYLVKKREEFVDFMNKNTHLDSKIFTIEYIRNTISKDRLEETFEKQLVLKKTLIGPQRDDYQIFLGNNDTKINAHTFGSRSEQRLALFWILTNQIKLIQEIKKQRPIVLLDDIFSELDMVNKALILHLIKNYQTVVTTIEPEVIALLDSPHTIIKL